jgi:hypothetical protein
VQFRLQLVNVARTAYPVASIFAGEWERNRRLRAAGPRVSGLRNISLSSGYQLP